MSQKRNITGKVILAGAGPGDPELLTLKAARFLESADVILVDRLVSPEILLTHANPKAEIIYVGKQCGKGNSTKQLSINAMLVELASQHKLIVRLKGGDVSFFSNILDELETLIENGISYEIIPGVTAASGAGAYAGIPLTARDHSTAVRFLTYYKSEVLSEEYWRDLATTNDTIVFYMSGEATPAILSKLREHNIDPCKKIAMVAQATTPMQQVFVSDIYDVNEKLSQNFISPSLIIIGKVVNLHAKFAWVANSEQPEHYFNPIAKLGSVLSENKENAKEYAGRA
ncbi:MAG: uroporphyrinogen-III C-methyltransferase [Chitinophagaceae bacterium]|nr:MAG: uroporphyrinogen-III C-methyltransferase [Chitinophagaceae bacterium]